MLKETIEEMIHNYIKENLKVEVDAKKHYGYYENDTDTKITVTVKLGETTISESSAFLND